MEKTFNDFRLSLTIVCLFFVFSPDIVCSEGSKVERTYQHFETAGEFSQVLEDDKESYVARVLKTSYFFLWIFYELVPIGYSVLYVDKPLFINI